MMKILWFTITPCGAAEILTPDQPYGGWMSSLEKLLKQRSDIELSVAFYWNSKLDNFEYSGINYFPVYRDSSQSKLRRLISRVFNLYDDNKDIINLLSVIESVKPDLIHVHGLEENFGLIQSYTKIPTIVSIQSILSSYCLKYFSGVPRYESIVHDSLKNTILFNSSIYNYKLTKRCAERELIIFKNTSVFLGRTDWDLKISRLLSPNSTYFVGNEIIREKFYVNKWNKNEFNNTIKIITTMSGGLYKGLETIVQTCEILLRNGFNDFEWIIVGQTKKKSLPIIVKNWLKIDYNQLNVKFAGVKSENELVSLLLDSDIYCQVSHIENSPNSLCEAMLLGMPTIASYAGGTESLLENRIDGFLYQDGDAYSLASIIKGIRNDFIGAKQLGLNAYNKAHQRHNPDIILENLIDSYCKTIELKPKVENLV